MSLSVEAIGAAATLQDGGRPGHRRYGVPVGGAFDRESYELGNALVGNGPAAAALELTVTGGRFRADGRHRVAVVGAKLELSVNGFPLRQQTPVDLAPGDVLALGTMHGGARSYLCVGGGFLGEPILGSLSGIPVRKGDSLLVGPQSVTPAVEGPATPLASLRPRALRLLRGPQFALFRSRDFAQETYEVSPHCNRAGIRLTGPPMDVPAEAPSEPMCVGAVQITRDGMPVVIGPDGPTIGGYPKIACLIEADLDRLGQLLPGDTVRFEWAHAPARAFRDPR